GLGDLRQVFDRHAAEIIDATVRAMSRQAELVPLLRGHSPDELRKGFRGLIAHALAGEKQDFEAQARRLGKACAGGGLQFSVLQDAVRVFERQLVDRLVETYAGSPARLSEALAAAQDLICGAMAIVCEECLLTKEHGLELRASEERSRHLFES